MADPVRRALLAAAAGMTAATAAPQPQRGSRGGSDPGPRDPMRDAQNTGGETARYLEMFASDRYTDVSADQWLALAPPDLVAAHPHLRADAVAALRKTKQSATG